MKAATEMTRTADLLFVHGNYVPRKVATTVRRVITIGMDTLVYFGFAD